MNISRLISYTCQAALCLGLAAAAHAADTVERWGLFEITLQGPTNRNPFVDVELSARFRHGDTLIDAPGFYDGAGTYRVRFMPDAEGQWSYVTHSGARALDAQTGGFTVIAPGTNNHGPVQVAHTCHFAYADGAPYRELGTTSYGWIHQTDELQDQTLKTLAASPFNKLRFCVFPLHNNQITNEPPRFPFEHGEAPDQWNFTRFNVDYFQHLEKRVADLQALGIEADVILFHPYDGGHWGFDRMPAEADDRYLRYIVARLSAYRNVWWSLANEWDLMRRKNEADFVSFGELVSSTDPSHHLLSIHNSAQLFNNSLPWITHASIQNGSAVEDPGRAELYRDVWRKPVVYDEVKYEGDLPRRWGNLPADELVFRFWNGTVAGTYVGHGESYSNPGGLVWISTGGALHGQSPARLAFLKQILDTSPPEGLDPIDKWQNPQYGGQPAQYYLVYLGKSQPASWKFRLPRPKLEPGMKFKADIIDTWNMTTNAVDAVFTLRREDNAFFCDTDNRSIDLPSHPYLAIRIQRLKE